MYMTHHLCNINTDVCKYDYPHQGSDCKNSHSNNCHQCCDSHGHTELGILHIHQYLAKCYDYDSIINDIPSQAALFAPNLYPFLQVQ